MPQEIGSIASDFILASVNAKYSLLLCISGLQAKLHGKCFWLEPSSILASKVCASRYLMSIVGKKNVKHSQHLSRSLLQNHSLNWTHLSRWLMTNSVCNAISHLHLDRIHNYFKAHTKIIWTFFRSTSNGWFIIKLAVNYNPKTCSPFTAV